LASKEPLPEHQFLYWAAWQHFQNFDALEIAAEMAYAQAQLILGLKLAKLNLVTSTEVDTSNESSDDVSGNARLKKAVYWLKQAANQGLRDAWYALGLINRMPQYSGYSAEDSDACFDKAAELGYPEAQYKKGAALWRRRSQLDEPIEGLQASYWVWHAAQQGVIPAKELLSKMMLSSPNPSNNDWFHLAQATQLALNETPHRYSAEMLLMCHRVIVANQLNLSKAELLLIDMMSVQHEHGAVIDIREHLPKSTPKLILIETLEQRKALMIASKAFASAATIDEGNLRQRRYRLDKLIETLVETSELTQAAALDPQDLT
jgi:TPR repeat protein